MNNQPLSAQHHPAWVKELEATFGEANQAAFGTAVFYEPANPHEPGLEQLAQKWYQFFCGGTWEKFGPGNWLGEWKLVADSTENILDELANLEDSSSRRSASTMLEGHEDLAVAQQALSKAFDDPAMTERRIYRIGDGGAMSGILIAGRRDGGESVFLTFLLD